MKIAVASDNWVNVERHLEEDGQFIILRSVKGKLDYEGIRMIKWKEDEIFLVLADCDVIFCRFAEKSTKSFIERNGIKVIETHGPIAEIINDYLNSYLFENITCKKYKQEKKSSNKIQKVRQ